MRILMITLLLLTQPGTALAATCGGGDISIASANVKGVTTSGRLNQYRLEVTVMNSGMTTQPNNTLQFVNMYDAIGAKLDAKGIPPLQPGKSYTVDFPFQRSIDAGIDTTKLTFQLAMEQPSCNTDNDKSGVTF